MRNAFQDIPQFAGAIHLSAAMEIFVNIVAVALLHINCRESVMKTLGEFIVEKQHEFSHATGELTALLSAIKLGAKIIHRDINKAGLVDILGASGAENVQGEVQQKLDLYANEKLKAA
ncbi:hypothetical protein PDN10_27335, partial [Bacillus cereus]|nr:hypothetical protein [Bacillus cereus]